jgi:serine/threonine protein phosphatase 1
MITFDDKIDAGDVIAVGDIHARYDLFELFLDHVRGTEAIVILLGDIIDRGGQDLQVLDKVRELLNDPKKEGLSNLFCLMGNHEGMFVDALTGTGSDYRLWMQNGGNFEQYDEMREHLEWIAELPVYMTVNDTMFTHAGIAPGRDPYELVDRGKVDTLLWMREPFLTYGPQFEKWNPALKKMVFGHTPKSEMPYEIPQGLCIDTGAYHTGVLTSYNMTRDTVAQFSVK